MKITIFIMALAFSCGVFSTVIIENDKFLNELDSMELFNSGIPSSISILSKSIKSDIDSPDFDKKVELCYKIEFEYDTIDRLSFRTLIGDFEDRIQAEENFFGERIISSQFEFFPDNEVGFTYDLDDFELKVSFKVSSKAFQGVLVDHINSIFSRNFNQEKPVVQTRYNPLYTIDPFIPSAVIFCEQYYFNSNIVPEDFLVFLLGKERVAFLELTNRIDFDVNFIKKSTGEILSRYRDNISIDVDVPVSGIDVSEFSRDNLSEEVRNSIANQFNTGFNDLTKKFRKQKKIISNWLEFSSNLSSDLTVFNILYPKSCEFISKNYPSSIDKMTLLSSRYAYDHDLNGCEIQSSQILLNNENLDCIVSNRSNACEVPAPEGNYYLFSDVNEEYSVLYIEDSIDFNPIPPVSLENLYLDLVDISQCHIGFVDQGYDSGITPLFIHGFLSKNNPQKIFQSSIDLAARKAETIYPYDCNPFTMSDNLQSIRCNEFESNNLLCEHFVSGETRQLLITPTGRSALYVSFAKQNCGIYSHGSFRQVSIPNGTVTLQCQDGQEEVIGFPQCSSRFVLNENNECIFDQNFLIQNIYLYQDGWIRGNRF